MGTFWEHLDYSTMNYVFLQIKTMHEKKLKFTSNHYRLGDDFAEFVNFQMIFYTTFG